MESQNLDDLILDAHGRVEAGHGLLENHANAVAANLLHLFLVEGDQINSFEQNAAAIDAGGRRRQETHDRLSGDALAAA
jgi:hypothetical protein